MREHIVAADDEGIEPVLGMKMRVLDLGAAGCLYRLGFFLPGSLLFLLENEAHVVLLSQKF